MDEDEVQAVVIDNGSGYVKAGFAGDNAPRAVIETVVGRPKMPGIMVGIDQKEVYVGEEVCSNLRLLKTGKPIQRGLVDNWDDMEKIWNHTIYNELKVSPEEHPWLITETPLNPKEDRERLTQIMFEVFNVPWFYLQQQAVLALYSTGLTTGFIIDCGEGVSNTVPIYEAYAIPHAVRRIPLAGQDITQYLSQLMFESGTKALTGKNDLKTVQVIKERLCDVAYDSYESAAQTADDVYYELPDKTSIKLGAERYQCAEILFNPSMAGFEQLGIHEYVMESILECDIDIRSTLLDNMYLAGGTTLFQGLPERMHKEISNLESITKKPVLKGLVERQFSTWLGGSLWAALSSFQSMWINKSEYDAEGPNIIHKKCF